MQQTATVIAATTCTPLVSFLERAVRPRGMAVTLVRPEPESLVRAVCEGPVSFVAIHAMAGDDDWLQLAHAVKTADPAVKVLALAERAEVTLIARAIANGVDHFALFGGSSDLLAMQSVVTDTLAGQGASAESAFGRVRKRLQFEKTGEGRYRTASGRRISARKAIQQCVGLGLTSEDIARLLEVSEEDAAAGATKALRMPRVPTPTKSWMLNMAGLAVIAGLALGGVSRRREEKRFVPVSGVVFMGGRSLAHARIFFCKEGGSHIASGRTDERGEYRLMTLRPGDGAEEGVHVVWVGAPSRFREHIEMNDPEYAEKLIRLHERMREESEAGVPDEADAIPETYRAMHTSPLRAEVKGREPLRLNFTLKR